VRSLDTLQPQLLPGTEDAFLPFWSPDSRWIGFLAQGKLKKIAATGGPAQTLCDAQAGRGGAWNRDGTIIFIFYLHPGVHLWAAPGAGGGRGFGAAHQARRRRQSPLSRLSA